MRDGRSSGSSKSIPILPDGPSVSQPSIAAAAAWSPRKVPITGGGSSRPLRRSQFKQPVNRCHGSTSHQEQPGNRRQPRSPHLWQQQQQTVQIRSGNSNCNQSYVSPFSIKHIIGLLFTKQNINGLTCINLELNKLI